MNTTITTMTTKITMTAKTSHSTIIVNYQSPPTIIIIFNINYINSDRGFTSVVLHINRTSLELAEYHTAMTASKSRKSMKIAYFGYV